MDHILSYLTQGRVMQLATMKDGKPWICSVYYVFDDNKLYWLSLPDRRHSRDINENSNIAIAIVIKPDVPVIGVQAEGQARIVDDPKTVERIAEAYIKLHGVGKTFYTRFMAGTNQHVLYEFAPKSYWLFDEQTFGDGIRREWNIEEE